MAYGKSQLTNPEIARLELEALPLNNEQHDLLVHTTRQLQRVANQCVDSWREYHNRRSSLLKLESGNAVHPCPPELCARWLRESQALCPDVHCGTILAVTNWLAQTYTSQKSPAANIKRWIRVLKREEGAWDYTRPLPIRLWNGNAKVERRDGGVAIVIRVDRRMVEGKKNAESTPIPLMLLRPTQSNRRGKHLVAYLAAAEIADGKRKLAQSQLSWDPRQKKWFLFMTIDGPAPNEQALRDPTAVLCIRPGRESALRIHADAISGSFGDAALDRVAATRARIDERLASWRRENGDAPAPFYDSLAIGWRQQSASICDAIIAEVVRSLKDRHYGKVLWFDGNNRKAALAHAGRGSPNDSRELFPFEQLRRKAEKRLGELGIEVVGRANFRSVKRRKQERRKRLSMS